MDGEGGGDSRAYHVMPNNQINIPLNQINPGWGNEVNMGDPQVLISFSTYCINNYPADRYLIIPQDHGGSWVGCCWDDSGDNLDIDDLQTAFQQISVVLGRKTDVVFFNDCLMNGVEIAYQLQSYVEFQAGSETISWTSTCNDEYENILQYMVDNPDVAPQDLATYITNHQEPRDSASYRTQCISTFELDRMQDLASAVDDLALDLYNKLDDDAYRDQIENARTQSEYTEGPYGGQIERLIDLYDFVNRIHTLVTDPTTQSLAQDVLDLLGPAGGQYGNVINRERHTTSVNFCHGMSVYFPDRMNRYDGTYLIDNDFVSDTNWDEFLGEYLNGGTGVGYGWDMSINAKGGANGTAYFTFGEDEYATDGYDETTDVQHTDLPTDVEIYSLIDSIGCSVDIKHGPDTSKIWDIYVEWQGSDSGTVELSWDASPIPNEEYPSVVLYDCDNNEQIDMLTSSSYSLTMNVGETLHMKIICSSSENNPPVKPQPPSGPTSGKPGRECTYTAVTIDPDGDLISYVFDWGDDTTTQTPFVSSGQVASATHKWSKKGNYEIKVKAIDEQGMESDWSDPLSVRMPRTISFKSFFLKLLERFPHAFPVLQHLLEAQRIQ
ncbi:MAG: clostripain-related cysteine peptidase [Euryarchaeota archaeon]|nr:clostripain-related cysteine peptidase [Euryarchaeota archaeon]